MSQAEPTVHVRCPTCHTVRLITVSYQRRLRKEHRPAPCTYCERLGAVVSSDDDLWWWLEQYGVERNGITITEHISLYGLPAGLVDLLDGIRPGAV